MTDTRSATVVVRLKPSGLQAIDQHAKTAGVTRSEMIRRLLGEALAARQKRN